MISLCALAIIIRCFWSRTQSSKYLAESKVFAVLIALIVSISTVKTKLNSKFQQAICLTLELIFLESYCKKYRSTDSTFVTLSHQRTRLGLIITILFACFLFGNFHWSNFGRCDSEFILTEGFLQISGSYSTSLPVILVRELVCS